VAPLLDPADVVEHPLHGLGLHGWAWVATALAIALLLAIAAWALVRALRSTS
jgi:hypothetical protein